GVEDPLGVPLDYTVAVVDDTQSHVAGALGEPDLDGVPTVSPGVGQEVADDLAAPQRVRCHDRLLTEDRDVEGQGGDYGFCLLPEVEVGGLDGEAATLHTGRHEQVF